jgi:hypothetical protein
MSALFARQGPPRAFVLRDPETGAGPRDPRRGGNCGPWRKAIRPTAQEKGALACAREGLCG